MGLNKSKKKNLTFFNLNFLDCSIGRYCKGMPLQCVQATCMHYEVEAQDSTAQHITAQNSTAQLKTA